METETARWVTFDCYGTLIDWEGGITAAMARLWPNADRARLLRCHHAVEPLVQQEQQLPYREVLARTLRAVAAIEGLLLDPAHHYALADSLPSWPAFPDVPDALRDLKRRGWRLAILSNTDPDLLAASLKQIGVPFDLTITAADAGAYKPAHNHWHTFFKTTGADRARHVHVAASPFHDLAPAHALKLRAIWINRLNENTTIPHDAQLPTLTDLPDTLDRLFTDTTRGTAT